MLDDRFWTKVDKTHPSGCWVWKANRNNKGYGLFRPGGTAPKMLAHRLSFQDANGQIPKGMIIRHSCDNPGCVNPSHLLVGTMADNVADMDSRGRRVSSPCRGEVNYNARMTKDTVTSLRKDYVAGVPISVLIEKYGCTTASLTDYTCGRSWKHLLGVDGCPTLEELKAEAYKRRRNSTKLTQDQVDTIRDRLKRGELGKDLAAEYGVHKATISDIKTGKNWPTS